MKRRSSKQPTDKKPIFNKELWREIPATVQGKVRGGGLAEEEADAEAFGTREY